MYPKCVQNLINCFESLPGIGEKTAERLTFALLEFEKEKLEEFSLAIDDVNKKIKKCVICNNLTDKEKCYICEDEGRGSDTIFVLENSKDVILFEKMGIYKGHYHVLGGLISPLDGVCPEDINLDSLVERIKSGNYKEIIIALKPSVEGETTAQYIKKMLEDYNVSISKIANGVPMGAEIEYIDPITLEMALEERKYIS